MNTINWDKPKGQVFGKPPVPGARYEQNGLYFNAAGVCLTREDETKDLTEEARRLVALGHTHTEVGKMLGETRQKITRMVS